MGAEIEVQIGDITTVAAASRRSAGDRREAAWLRRA